MALPDYHQESTELTNLALLYQLQNILNAGVIGNYLLIGQSADAITRTYYNANLYEVAVEYYGDFSLWTVIAQANNLRDPEVQGTITLLIPPMPTINNNGGVLPSFVPPSSLPIPLHPIS